MAPNEFENRVKKAMDGFKLHPSEEVWQKVEEKIQEKKKKRRILFFFIFSLAGLALAGYGVYNFSTRQISHQDTGSTENIHSSKNNTIHPTAIPNHEAAAFKKKDEAQKNIERREAESGTRLQKIRTLGEDKTVLFQERKNFIAVSPDDKNHEDNNKNIIPKPNQVKATEDVSFTEQPRPSQDTLHQKNIADSTGKSSTMIEPADSVSIINPENKTIVDKRIVKKGINKSAKKLKWGIMFSIGSSTITEDRFSFKGSPARAILLYSSPGSVTSGSLNLNPPAANQSAFAFKAGVVVKKDISRRSNISGGLQYAYTGDRIKIAVTQITSPQANNLFGSSSYYRSVPQKTFTNHYHFVELPVMYDWRMTGHTNHFLSVGAGISPGFLIATNGLVYDTSAGGIYFHNKSSFNRAHFSFMSGLSYHFGKNVEWSLGPQFYFDISKLINTDFDKRKYLLYGGIDARMFLEKKKKK